MVDYALQVAWEFAFNAALEMGRVRPNFGERAAREVRIEAYK